MKTFCAAVLLVLLGGLAALGEVPGPQEQAVPPGGGVSAVPPANQPNPATGITSGLNAQLLSYLNFADEQEFNDARRGFVASLPQVVIKGAAGNVVYDLTKYDFENDPVAPDSVNPSLWRRARLNLISGLFKVTTGIYQVRSFDISNMTIVEGTSGIIVIDPLSTVETARAGLDLYFSAFGKKDVKAVIYTHSHVDHYGGVKGVTTQADVDARKVRVIAPSGFLDAAVSENVYAGNAMSRRTAFWYGFLLPKGERGHVDIGLGKAYPLGTISLIKPTETVDGTTNPLTVDGVSMEVQMVSGTEAPSEMTLFFPAVGALNSAEVACPLVHNILTLRGAQVRDAKKWSEVLNDAIARYGDRVDVIFNQHNWPRWGQGNVVSYLAGQRDLYKYLHDQTLRLTNHGYTGTEIAEMLSLPPSLDRQWWGRGYYGTLSHNVKAIYQKYIGWYDGNPANLEPLPPEENAQRLVAYMGGSGPAILKARRDYDRGDYRWVAWLMGQVVFAEPQNWRARHLAADALEQLGYQAEAGTWRSAYLVGAYELRNGIPKTPGTGGSASPDSIAAMTTPQTFDYWGIRLNGEKAVGRRIVLNWTFTDDNQVEKYALNLENCALTYRVNYQATGADASLTLSRKTLDAITLGQTTFEKEVALGNIAVSGNPARFTELMSIMDTFVPDFPIVTP